ncbi:MAG: hypothetical protein AB1724_16465 [Thermodesulfobacteriota bacterium]
MADTIKIYGERNTGTNYLGRLIDLNLNARQLPGVVPPFISKLQKILPGNEIIRDLYFSLSFSSNLGWKHTRVSPAALKTSPLVNSNLVILTVTRNPYAWLLSLYRRPYHQRYADNPSFETFLQRPWKTTRRDNTGRILKNPVELWNIKNNAYLGLQGLAALNLTAEGILADPAGVMKQISGRFSIPRRTDRFVDHERSTKDRGKDVHYYRDYYLNEKWKSDLSAGALAIINEFVDRRLMDYFGYQILAS